MASPAIEFRSVGLEFDQDQVLKNVNLSVARGETFVIIGPSGEGKSVLLKMMAGILLPSSGQVMIEGQDFYALNEDEQISTRRRMGMLFQKNALFDSMTAAENIRFPLLETTRETATEIERRVEFFLDAVGLKSARDLYPDEISGGMQKRLGIARALALDPEIIYYDDPTAGLDPITSRKIIDLIINLKREKGSTVVAITNDMNRAYQMADRIGIAVQGEFLVTGTPEETRNHADPRVRQFVRGELSGPLREGP